MTSRRKAPQQRRGPFGYVKDEGGRYVQEEREGTIVKSVFRRLQRESILEIAQALKPRPAPPGPHQDAG